MAVLWNGATLNFFSFIPVSADLQLYIKQNEARQHKRNPSSKKKEREISFQDVTTCCTLVKLVVVIIVSMKIIIDFQQLKKMSVLPISLTEHDWVKESRTIQLVNMEQY